MSIKTVFVTMARYNRWMNEKLYQCCSTLDEDALRLDRGAFFKSIWGTLNHLLVADRLWLGRFHDRPFEFTGGLDAALYPDFRKLRAGREKTDAEIPAFVDALDEARTYGELRYTTFLEPHPRVTPMAHALMHFFNHRTQHRGQLTTLLFQAGVGPGVTDLLYLPDNLRA